MRIRYDINSVMVLERSKLVKPEKNLPAVISKLARKFTDKCTETKAILHTYRSIHMLDLIKTVFSLQTFKQLHNSNGNRSVEVELTYQYCIPRFVWSF